MSWAVGYDETWRRDVGYGVPAYCDHPGCNERIDRGLAYKCGADDLDVRVDGGCGLFFCAKHLGAEGLCRRCECNDEPFIPKLDHEEWLLHKLTHPSWALWREMNQLQVKAILLQLPPTFANVWALFGVRCSMLWDKILDEVDRLLMRRR